MKPMEAREKEQLIPHTIKDSKVEQKDQIITKVEHTTLHASTD